MKFLIFTFILISGVAFSQNPATDNTSWRSDILFDSTDRATMPFVSEFRVFPAKKKIDWVQNNNSYVTSFSINDAQGKWLDLKSDGKLVFAVTYFGRSGQLSIERSGGLTRIGLRILEGGKNLLPLSFSINNIIGI
ncbi:MAG: hypothetical protein ACKO3B_06290 [Bacteroidota bacterium]